jgi:hypothetical protein
MIDHWTEHAVSLLNPIDSELLTAGSPLPVADLPSPTPRRRRRWLPAVGVVAVLVGGATAYAATQHDDTRIVNLQCELPTGDSMGRVQTGDPIADCTAQWKSQTNIPVPPLVVYVFRDVTYYVQPASAPAPKDPRMRLLTGPIATAPTLNELKDALADELAGPSVGCATTDQARARINGIVTRLDLTGIPIRLLDEHGAPRTADGQSTCAQAALDTGATDTAIALFSMPASSSGQGDAFDAFLVRLRKAPSCPDLSDAKGAVTAAAQASGINPDPDAHQLSVTTLPDPGSACTRIYVEPGGAILVTLYGPA